jgi:hypothetical protein
MAKQSKHNRRKHQSRADHSLINATQALFRRCHGDLEFRARVVAACRAQLSRAVAPPDEKWGRP